MAAGDYPNISYVTTGSTDSTSTGFWNTITNSPEWNSVGTTLTGVQGLGGNLGAAYQAILGRNASPGEIDRATGSQLAAAIDAAKIWPAKETYMRLLTYTVVNPDQELVKVNPGLSILKQGTIAVNGTDDRGFLMELATELKEPLELHNTALGSLTYRDKEGKMQTFRPVRLGQLDVVIQVLKDYK